MALELWLHLLVHFFLVHWILSLLNFLTVFVQLGFYFLWWLWHNDKDLHRSTVAKRVTVEHVAAVLTVVLAQPPPERLAEQLL